MPGTLRRQTSSPAVDQEGARAGPGAATRISSTPPSTLPASSGRWRCWKAARGQGDGGADDAHVARPARLPVRCAPTGAWSGPRSCAHAAFGPARGSQTTGSMVSHLRPGHPCRERRRALHQPLQAGLARRAVAAHRPTPSAPTTRRRSSGDTRSCTGACCAIQARHSRSLAGARNTSRREWGKEARLHPLAWHGAQLSRPTSSSARRMPRTAWLVK